MHFPERLFYLNSFIVIFVPLQYRWELTSHVNCPNSKQQEWPELNLNRAEVTELNRKLKLGFSHSKKDSVGVRRKQKAHVLHSKVLAMGEHISLFLLSSASQERDWTTPVNCHAQLETDSLLSSYLVWHSGILLLTSSLGPAEKGNCRNTPNSRCIQDKTYSEFCIAQPPLFLAASLPPCPPKEFHIRREGMSS